mgnify:CR=1 FL=1
MKSLIGAGLVFAAAMGAPAFAQNNWNKPTEPFHIAGNIYYVGTEGLGAYLVTGPGGHVLLDGATPQGAPIIEANIAKLGFKLALVPKANAPRHDIPGMRVVAVERIDEALERLRELADG